MTSALRKRCEEAAKRLMVEDNMAACRLVNGSVWWWEDHAMATIADAIEAEAKRFAEQALIQALPWPEVEMWFNNNNKRDKVVAEAIAAAEGDTE